MSRITDAGLAHIAGMDQLMGLEVPMTEITDAGLEHLAGLHELRFLSLAFTRVTDRGVARLRAALPSLVSISYRSRDELSPGANGAPVP